MHLREMRKMNLAEELRRTTNNYGKVDYDEIVKKMSEAAMKGEDAIYIDGDEVLQETIDRLDKEGISTRLMTGENYHNEGSWTISW